MTKKKMLARIKSELDTLKDLVKNLQKEPDELELWVYAEDCEAIGDNLKRIHEDFEKDEDD